MFYLKGIWSDNYKVDIGIIDIAGNTVNLGPSVVTTDIEDYIDELSACYKEGFCLNHFVKIPGVKATVEVQDWGTPYPYQAILSKPTDR